jgi:phosphoglycerol transferase
MDADSHAIAETADRDEPIATQREPRSARTRAAVLYLASAVLGLLGAAWAMNLWQADLRVPFNYEGDALFHVMLIKVMVEKGWYEHTDALGAPEGLMLQDFPAADNLSCAMIKAMTLFTSDPVLLGNLFFLLTFPLTAASALFVARKFGISAGPALLVSFLYALLPYHFFRGTVHLFYSAYFLVPPAILIAWWISSGRLLAHGRRRVWFSLAVSVLLGCNMVYYPFFACFLLLVATIVALRRRDTPHVIAGALTIAMIAGVIMVNLLPAILYAHEHGPAPSGKRYSWEAEWAGLKISQLLLPVTGHRVQALARLKAAYNATHPLVNENDWASLGFIGAAGFLFLIGWVLFVRLRVEPATARDPRAVPRTDGLGPLIEHLSVFNAAAILLATIGGFSSLFAVLVSPQIRGYNRICVFIAYLSLLTVAAGLEWVRLRFVRSRGTAVIFGLALSLLGLLGYLDQTGADAYHDWAGLRRDYRNDKDFFARVQKSLPLGSMIFELPYEPFPEYGITIHHMIEYALLRPYLLTHGLRWSYGVIKGRPGDIWEKDVAAEPIEQMVQTLHQVGFRAIYIDRSAYADDGAALAGKLRGLVSAPISDAEGRFSLYKLAAPVGPPPPLESILPLPPPVWAGGFYDLEGPPDEKDDWRWCAAEGELQLFNDTKVSRHERLKATLRVASPAEATLHITSALFGEDIRIDPAQGTPFSRVVDLPAGETTIHFHCDGKPLATRSTDTRSLVWRIDGFTMKTEQ